jgi:hypothetical protein
MVTTVRNPIRRARRQMQNVQGRMLNTWAEERLNYDDYDPFMQFCKDYNPSMSKTTMVSEATFERLQLEFEEKKRQEA